MSDKQHFLAWFGCLSIVMIAVVFLPKILLVLSFSSYFDVPTEATLHQYTIRDQVVSPEGTSIMYSYSRVPVGYIDPEEGRVYFAISDVPDMAEPMAIGFVFEERPDQEESLEKGCLFLMGHNLSEPNIRWIDENAIEVRLKVDQKEWFYVEGKVESCGAIKIEFIEEYAD